MEADDLWELVDLVYAAAVDEAGWDVFLERLGAVTGSDVVPFLVWDYAKRDGQCLRVFPLDEEAIREYAFWSAKNPYVRQSPRLQTGELRIVEPSDPAVRDSEFYNEWLRPRLGVGHNLASCVSSAESSSVHLSPLRDPRGPAYGSDEVRLMQALMPHLRRATSVQRRLGEAEVARATAIEALDSLPTATFFLGRDRAVQWFNREARRVLELGDGLALDRVGRLSAASPSENTKLERLTGEACRTGAGEGMSSGGVLRLTRPSGDRPFQLLVSPLRLEESAAPSRTPRALVLLSDPDRPGIQDGAALRQLFGLTPAEARLAAVLARGLRLAEAAEKLGVTEATARTHVKRILEKTESRTQAQLMRVLCAVPPVGARRR
jgi:DNA-binding CsgD family transcriptional regulator